MTRLVIGIGHPFRGDDAVGLAVVEAVASLHLPHLDTLFHHGEGTDLMERWCGYDDVVVVDAVVAAGLPLGAITVWDTQSSPLPAARFPKGSHVFGLVEAVELARSLGRLPARLHVVGVAAHDFTLGRAMSAAVTAAIPNAVVIVLDLRS